MVNLEHHQTETWAAGKGRPNPSVEVTVQSIMGLRWNDGKKEAIPTTRCSVSWLPGTDQHSSIMGFSMKDVCTAGPETRAPLAMDRNLWHRGLGETVPTSKWFMSGICQVDKGSSTLPGVISPCITPAHHPPSR